MGWRIQVALGLEVLAVVVTMWCLLNTTALSMTAFFAIGVPLFGLAAVFYVWEVVLDLRRHEVL